jgi:hypothetical protein
MGQLIQRLRILEQSRRAFPADVCPEHLPSLAPSMVDYRDGLRAMSPFAEDRAAYAAEQDALEAQPPCDRCGWRPFVVRVRVPVPDAGGGAA